MNSYNDRLLHKPTEHECISHYDILSLCALTASAKAFDQYGEMVSRYEKQLELKEKAETLATDVNHTFVYLIPNTFQYHLLALSPEQSVAKEC